MARSFTAGNAYNQGVAAAKVGNATASQVLSGQTFTNSSGNNNTGTMRNNGTVTSTIASGGSYTIPSGYHTGSGKISRSSKSGTYTVNSPGSNKDMGASNSYRYVATSGLVVTPTATKSVTANGTYTDIAGYGTLNVNVALHSGTYTIPNNAGSTTALDMGQYNTYRYINSSSFYTAVYNAGYNTHLGVGTISTKLFNNYWNNNLGYVQQIINLQGVGRNGMLDCFFGRSTIIFNRSSNSTVTWTCGSYSGNVVTNLSASLANVVISLKDINSSNTLMECYAYNEDGYNKVDVLSRFYKTTDSGGETVAKNSNINIIGTAETENNWGTIIEIQLDTNYCNTHQIGINQTIGKGNKQQ